MHKYKCTKIDRWKKYLIHIIFNISNGPFSNSVCLASGFICLHLILLCIFSFTNNRGQHIELFDYDCSLFFPVPHMVRAMASSQSIPIPQGASVQDRVGRTRQPSECVRTRSLYCQLWLGDRGPLSLRSS